MSPRQSSLSIAVCVAILAIVSYNGIVESKVIDYKSHELEAPNHKIKRSDQTYSVLLHTLEQKPRYRFTGSVYYRWGSSECGADSELIYEGIVGGGYYRNAGSAVNALCLPRDPDLEESPSTRPRTLYGYLYGAEYKMGPNKDNDVPCAVCSTPNRMKNLMIPAKVSCPKYWKKEYDGWLAAGYYAHAAASEFVCVDGGFETDAGGYKSLNGKLFYHVQTRCGSLPCPNYADKKIVPCVVCSK